MKRRIISSILVVVMLVLSLVGCGYSYANDKALSSYVPFTDEEKAAFEAAIKAIVIEDGEFTRDPATRAKKVLEKINSALASAADKTDKKTEGTPDALRDLVYYCYYFTAEIDGVPYVFSTSTMKSTSPANVQLGQDKYDDDFISGVVEALGTLDFTDKTYEANTSATKKDDLGKTVDVTAQAGDLVFVTYSYSYTETVDGVEKEKTGKYTSHPMIVEAVADGATAANLAQFLCGKKNATSITDKFEIEEDGKGKVTYSGIKIDWIANGDAVTSFDVELKEAKTAVATYAPAGESTSKELKIGTTLKYYVFPTHYIEVEEFNALNLVNTILGSKVTYNDMVEILFGEDYVNLDEEDEKDAEKIEELKELVKKYEKTDADGKTVTLEDLVEKLATLQADITKAKTSHEDAKEKLDEAQEAYDAAEKVITDKAAKNEEATDLEIKKRDDAKKALETATTDEGKAKEAYDKAVADRDAKVAEFFAVEGTEADLVKGFRVLTYNGLQTEYNHELKMKLAAELYYFINKYVKVEALPEEAVELTYKQLLENYETTFYTGDYDTTNKVSNYNKFKGSFKAYLVEAVYQDSKDYGDDVPKGLSYDETLEYVYARAEEINKPIARIYRLAEAYGVLVTDKEFDEYKNGEDTKYEYQQKEFEAGKNSVRHSYQFDKLLNYWLAEKDPTEADKPDDDGYLFSTPNYERIDNEYLNRFGEPASKKDAQTEEDGE